MAFRFKKFMTNFFLNLELFSTLNKNFNSTKKLFKQIDMSKVLLILLKIQ